MSLDNTIELTNTMSLENTIELENRIAFENTLAFAQGLDAKDPLKDFRKRFFIPQHHGKDCIYLTGNSLGLQARSTALYVQQELDDWAQFGVEGHFQARNPWMPYHEIFPRQLSTIVGAREDEIVVMNQLTVNLHLLMVTFYRPTKERYKIICEAKAFPSDQYAFESQVRYHGLDPETAIIEVSPRQGAYLAHRRYSFDDCSTRRQCGGSAVRRGELLYRSIFRSAKDYRSSPCSRRLCRF